MSSFFPSTLIACLSVLWVGTVISSWMHQHKTENPHILYNSLDLENTDINVLGNIPYNEHSKKNFQNGLRRNALVRAKTIYSDLISYPDNDSFMPGTYQAIFHEIDNRTHLNIDNTFLVTSPETNIGTTTTAVNLAIQMAKSGNRTLIVDGNFKRPILDLLLLGTHRDVGLTDLLCNQKNWRDLIRETSTKDLFLIPAGQHSDYSGKELPIKILIQFLLEVKSAFDVIVFDSAPIFQAAETASYASVLDSVILVAKSRKTSIEALLNARRAILKYNPDILGVLISGIHEEDFYDFTQYYNMNIEWPLHNAGAKATGTYST